MTGTPDGHPDDAPRLPSQVTLRPWAEGDDLRLLETWGDPSDPQQHQDRSMLRESTGESAAPRGGRADAAESRPPWARCLVAEDEGVPVAAGVVYSSSVHPSRLWFYAETAIGERRRGIGTVLLEALRAEADVAIEATGTAELKTRFAVESGGQVPAGAEATRSFLTGHGFQEIQRSRRVVVGPGVLAPPELTGGDGPVLEEAATGSVELTQAVVAFYQATHDWDPAQMTVGRAQKLLLDPATGASGAVVLRNTPREDGGVIGAFAISYTPERTEEPTDVLIGWDPELPAAEAQYAAGALLALLTTQYPVQLEVDDAMGALGPIVDQLISTGHARVLLDTRVWATGHASADETAFDAEAAGAAGPGAEPGPNPADLPDPLAGMDEPASGAEGEDGGEDPEKEPARP